MHSILISEIEQLPSKQISATTHLFETMCYLQAITHQLKLNNKISSKLISKTKSLESIKRHLYGQKVQHISQICSLVRT
ncbi:21651_t:CDS:2, partial [Gigaspora rosea]